MQREVVLAIFLACTFVVGNLGCSPSGIASKATAPPKTKVLGSSPDDVFPFVEGVEWTFGNPKDTYNPQTFTVTSTSVSQEADHKLMKLVVRGGVVETGDLILRKYRDRIELEQKLVSAQTQAALAGKFVLCQLPLVVGTSWRSPSTDVRKEYRGEVIRKEDACMSDVN